MYSIPFNSNVCYILKYALTDLLTQLRTFTRPFDVTVNTFSGRALDDKERQNQDRPGTSKGHDHKT